MHFRIHIGCYTSICQYACLSPRSQTGCKGLRCPICSFVPKTQRNLGTAPARRAGACHGRQCGALGSTVWQAGLCGELRPTQMALFRLRRGGWLFWGTLSRAACPNCVCPALLGATARRKKISGQPTVLANLCCARSGQKVSFMATWFATLSCYKWVCPKIGRPPFW